MFKLAVALVAAALLGAQPILAQSECVTNCLTEGLTSSSCGNLEDTACLCTDDAYQTAVATCVTTNCPDDLDDAVALQTALCTEETETGTETTSATEETGEEPTDSSDETEETSTAPTTTRATTTRATTTSTPRTTGTNSAATTSSTSSTGAGFHSASIASGVTVVLFGAALSLF